MGIGIFQCGGLVILLVVKNDFFVEDGDGFQFVVYFVILGCDVLGIFEKYFVFFVF